MEKGAPVFFAFVPDLLDHLRTAFDPESLLSYDELFDQVKSIPILVLDDLGAQSGTGWAEEKLFQILNHRYISALPTIITTTISIDHQEERVRSRLMDARISRIVDLGSVSRLGGPGIGDVEPELLKIMDFDQFEVSRRSTDRESQETLRAALSAAQSFANHPDGWLVLLGNPGCGKTHLAVAIAKQRIHSGGEVFFAFVPDLLDYLRYTFSPDSRITYDELFDKVKRTPLLILDDLGSESTTAWAHEKLYQIIVHRHNARLPTIITTRGIPNTPNDPIASRLEDPRVVVVVPITAPDFRHQGTQPNRASKRTRFDGRAG
jgi:DNA replication protein DnaC